LIPMARQRAFQYSTQAFITLNNQDSWFRHEPLKAREIGLTIVNLNSS
jgi:hypothetical protein